MRSRNAGSSGDVERLGNGGRSGTEGVRTEGRRWGKSRTDGGHAKCLIIFQTITFRTCKKIWQQYIATSAVWCHWWIDYNCCLCGDNIYQVIFLNISMYCNK